MFGRVPLQSRSWIEAPLCKRRQVFETAAKVDLEREEEEKKAGKSDIEFRKKRTKRMGLNHVEG